MPSVSSDHSLQLEDLGTGASSAKGITRRLEVDRTLYTEKGSCEAHPIMSLFTWMWFCGPRLRGHFALPRREEGPTTLSNFAHARGCFLVSGTAVVELACAASRSAFGQQGCWLPSSNPAGLAESSQSLAAPARAGLRRPGSRRWSRRC